MNKKILKINKLIEKVVMEEYNGDFVAFWKDEFKREGISNKEIREAFLELEMKQEKHIKEPKNYWDEEEFDNLSEKGEGGDCVVGDEDDEDFCMWFKEKNVKKFIELGLKIMLNPNLSIIEKKEKYEKLAGEKLIK